MHERTLAIRPLDEVTMANGPCRSCGATIPAQHSVDSERPLCPRCSDPLLTGANNSVGNNPNTENHNEINGNKPLIDPGFSKQPPSKKLPRLVKNYELLQEIGRGGMGLVYRARHVALDRIVALKVLRNELFHSDTEKRRFVVEAQVTGQLEHPNIVPVHEIGTDHEGVPFFIMKLVRGRALSDILMDLRKGLPEVQHEFPVDRLLHIFCEVCQATAFAHSKGVIHRDLKPSNVMIGDYGEVQVMDWGLAKTFTSSNSIESADSSASRQNSPGPRQVARKPTRSVRVSNLKSQAGFVAGTPEYMSPEQAIGDPSANSPISDVYSLGGLLFEMLTYRPPHMDRDTQILVHKVATEAVTFPAKGGFRPNVSKALRAVTLKALSHKQEDRYESAQALLKDVQAIIDFEPVVALPDTPLDKIVRLIRRHGTLVATISAALVLLSIGAAFAYRNLEQAANEKAVEREKRLKESDRRVLAEKSEKIALQKALKAEKKQTLLEAKAKETARKAVLLSNQLAQSMHLFPEALELIKRRQYRTAVKRLWRIINTDPTSPVVGPAWFYMGEANMRRGSIKYAKQAIENFVEADRVSRIHNYGLGSPRALLRAGEIAWRFLDDPGQARDFYNQAAQVDPQDPYSIMGKAYVHVLRGRENLSDHKRKEATKEARLALTLALEAAEKGRFLWEANYVAGNLLGGYELPGSGLKDAQKAHKQFTQALSHEPNLVELWLHRARTSEDLNQNLHALSDYNNALRIQPDNLNVHMNRARLLTTMGRHKEALNGLNSARKKGAGHLQFRLQRGRTSAALNMWEAAEQEFSNAINLNNQAPQAWLELAKTRIQLGKFIKAAQDAGEAYKLDPSLTEALRIQANAFLKTKKTAEALPLFKKLVAIDANDFESFKGLGNAARSSNKFNEAVQAFQKYLSLKPSDQAIRLQTIELMINDPKGTTFRPDAAVKLAKEANRQTAGKDPKVWLALAKSFQAAHKFREALNAIESAYTKFAGIPEIATYREQLRKIKVGARGE